MLKKIVKHTAIQAVGRIIGLLIGLFTIALLTRYLGQTGFGWYMVAFSWLQIFAIVVDFGLYMVGLKLLGESQGGQTEVFSQLFWLRLFSAIVFVLLLPQMVWFFPYEAAVKWAVAILSWSFFFANLNQLLTVSFQARLKMQYVAIGEIAGKFSAFLALVAVVYFDLGFYWVMVSVLAYSFVMLLFLFFQLGEKYKITWVWRADLIKRILKETWPLGLIIILNTVYFKADIIILSWYRDAADVGLYGAAYKILEILVSFPAMYLGLLLPFFSNWWQQRDLEKLKKYINQSIFLGWMVIVPMIVLGLFVSRPVMELVAGSDFSAAGVWLKFLLLAAAFIFFGQLFGYVLVAVGQQKKQLKIFLVVAVFSITAYLFLIPVYGTWAAVLITIVSELTACLLLARQVTKFTGWRWSKENWKVIGLGVVMFSVMWATKALSWWLFSLLGFLVYVYLLWLFDFLRFSDLKKLIKNR